jgi:hypothetical protein
MLEMFRRFWFPTPRPEPEREPPFTDAEIREIRALMSLFSDN